MKNKYLFFRLKYNEYAKKECVSNNDILSIYDMEIFSPSFFALKNHHANSMLYIFWFVVTFGKYRIIYLKKNDNIIHYTHLLPKFFKLPFLDSNDLEIGPSWTKDSHRGRGIFPAVICYLMQVWGCKDRTFHIFMHIDNISSRKAVEKAEFCLWAEGPKTGFFGIYEAKVINEKGA